MTRAGIEGIATYVPPGRLPIAEVRRHWPGVGAPGGVRSVSVAGYDEDVVTMGTEAADAALAASGLGAEDVDLIFMATSSSPYAEHSAAAEVARALGLRRAAAFADVAGSTTSGVTALAAAIDAVKVGRVDRALVISAERRRGRPGTAVEALGAGAAAVLVTAQGPLEALSTASWRHGVPTRWRPDGAASLHHYDDSRYELLGQILPAVSAVLDELGSDDGAVAAIGPLDVRSRLTLFRALHLGGDGGGSEVAETGDLGGAGPLFALAGHLTSGATGPIRCIGIEPGSGAVGVALRTGATVPVTSCRPAVTSVDYVEFLQRSGELGTVAPPPRSSPMAPPPVPPATTPTAA